MTATLLLSFLALAQVPQDSPVHVRLTPSYPLVGDVDVARDGYVLILGADRLGHPLVLYPKRPAHDGRVAAGTQLPFTSRRAERIVAVWSARPFDTQAFAANTFWSTDALNRAGDGSSLDALLGIARRMAGETPIAYDAATAPRPTPEGVWRRTDAIDFARPNYGRYLSPMEFKVRQAKFHSGAPPAVCNGNVCAQSVLWQLGNMVLRNP